MNVRGKLIDMATNGENYEKLWNIYSDFVQNNGNIRFTVSYGSEGILTILDDMYPSSLRRLHRPPIVLFYKGNIDLLSRSTKVSVVGTRRATSYGIEIAEKIGYVLGRVGVPVISGLAKGIDVSAHRTSVDFGAAIAVLGNGIDVYYPYVNKNMQDLIGKKGLLLSEYSYGMRGTRWSYIARNRIIAALSDLVVVVESPGKGGSIYTANFAIELGITVAAVPGDITRETSLGTNQLLADGAMVITKPSDVLDMIDISPKAYGDKKLIRILRNNGRRMNISDLKRYYDNTGELIKEISYLEMRKIVVLEGSVVRLIE